MPKNDDLLNDLDNVPNFIDEVIEDAESIKAMSQRYNYAKDFFYLGRGYSYHTALEGVLKLKKSHIFMVKGMLQENSNTGYWH